MSNGQTIDQSGRVVTPEEIRLGREVASRGDGFDIGEESGSHPEALATLLQNPTALFGSLTPEQAENIRALVVGGGSAAVYKMLSKHFGGAVAGALGGLVAAWLAEKVVKGGR